MIFSVTYYLKLRNAIVVYSTSHVLPTKAKLVVHILENTDIYNFGYIITLIGKQINRNV